MEGGWEIRVLELAMQIPGWDELQVILRTVHKVAHSVEIP